MPQVPVAGGHVALIDEGDLPVVSGHPWRLDKDGYARTNATIARQRKTLFMHRLILGALPGQVVDHANRNKLDNRRLNLRLATPRTNAANQAKQAERSSRFKGVAWHKQARRWQTQCADRYIGLFASEEEAARAYDRHAVAEFGEFAQLNFPGEGAT